MIGSDLVAHIPLDDAVGATNADDESGNANGGSYNGTVALQQGSLVRGITGAAEFDGATGYVDMGSGTEWNIGSSESWTALAWIRPAATVWDASRTHRVAMRYDGSNSGWGIWAEPNNSRIVAWVTDGNDANFSVKNESNFGRRILVGLHVDRSSDEHSVIVDEGLFDTTSISAVGAAGDGSLNLGRRPDNSSNFFHGKIQHLTVASTALSSATLTEIREQGGKFFDRFRGL